MTLLGDVRGSRQALTGLLTSSPEGAQLKSGSEHSGEASSFAQAPWWAGPGSSAELMECLLGEQQAEACREGRQPRGIKCWSSHSLAETPTPLTLERLKPLVILGIKIVTEKKS